MAGHGPAGVFVHLTSSPCNRPHVLDGDVELGLQIMTGDGCPELEDALLGRPGGL